MLGEERETPLGTPITEAERRRDVGEGEGKRDKAGRCKMQGKRIIERDCQEAAPACHA
jgi:hypothetical protein